MVTLNPDGTVRFEFSEVVKGFTSEDILVGGANLIPGSLVDLGDGVWTAKLDNMPTDGTTAQVTVKDNTYTDLNGNKGSGDSDEVITIKINSVTPNSQGGTTVEGTTEPGNTVEVLIPGSNTPIKVTADPVTGKWTVSTNTPMSNGNTVTATTPDQDKQPVQDQVKLPFVSIDPVAGDDVIDPSEMTAINQNPTYAVTGIVSDPNATVTVSFNGKTYSTDPAVSSNLVTVDSETGKWSIQVPVGDIQSQNTIEAQGSIIDNGTLVQGTPAERDPITKGSITVDVDSKGTITGTTTEVAPGQDVQLVIVGTDQNGDEIEKSSL